MSDTEAQRSLSAPTTADAASRLPLPPTQPQWIASEAQALEVAARLAEDFRQDAALRDQQRRLPWDELERYTASGFGAITIPRAYGGLGASLETLAQVFVTLCAADPSLGQIPQNHFALIQNLQDLATPAQQARWFSDVLAGHRLGNALSDIGHRDHKRRTRLEQTSAGWVLNGEKFYCTGAVFSHWIPVQAMQWSEADQPISVMVFVPCDAVGVTVTDDCDGMGQRVTGSGSVSLQNVAIQAEWIVPFQVSFDNPTTIGPVAEARTLCHSAGLLAANKLLELGGTSATFAAWGFDRYWRNVHTHTLHDPVRWKRHAIGNYALNDVIPPRYGAL